MWLLGRNIPGLAEQPLPSASFLKALAPPCFASYVSHQCLLLFESTSPYAALTGQ
jgi:hypothetical protein